jgi:putative restriction endonuclease
LLEEERSQGVRQDLDLMTVNSPSRRSYCYRETWRSDSAHRFDRLFKVKSAGRVTYQAHDPVLHGHWDLREGPNHEWQAVPLEVGELAQAEAKAQVAAFSFSPAINSDHDARVFSYQAVALRRGQATFRAELLEAYQGCCCITRTNAVAVLEAAHILPYRGEHTNRVDNGLLLRSDIHVLFDLGHIWIAPGFKVCIASILDSTEYKQLEGRTLILPNDPKLHPNREHLQQHAKLAKERSVDEKHD